MKDTTPAPGAQRSEQQPKNQGEGDKESAERFNKMEQEFVQSERGRQAIESVVELDDAEQDALEAAEREGKARAKGEDPAVSRADQDHRQHSKK